tara:strand:+ start:12 stop:215 length:204 start_codon:yes stop_codon:yes gene_type:complete
MSSIEWLVGKLSKEWQFEDRDLYLIEKAKEMEKDQIVDAVIYGNTKPSMASSKILGEQYYNENFKNK